jgi:iron(III) transport system substrate-binding protein
MLRPLALVFALLLAAPALGQEVVNVYSARHYDTDDALHEKFTEQTGIEVNVLEGDSDTLLARLRREGDLSAADVFITVDAGRLQQAVEAGLFAPIKNDAVTGRVADHLRHPDDLWVSLTKRVRVIFIAPERVEADRVTSYADLAEPAMDGRVLIRSSSNIYNQSLVAAMIETLGEDATSDFVEQLVNNLARTPQGGDTDQIRALAAGEGDVAVANHYYFARLLASDDAADRAVAEKVQLIFPDQDGRGAHVNVSGAGIVKSAPNRENAEKFLAFLLSDEAQQILAGGNFEYPAVDGVPLHPVLEGFGEFKGDDVNAAALGENNVEAVRLMDRAGWR